MTGAIVDARPICAVNWMRLKATGIGSVYHEPAEDIPPRDIGEEYKVCKHCACLYYDAGPFIVKQ